MPNRQDCTILVVDDEYASLEMLVLLLEGEGFHVVGASDGEEALERITAVVPSLVVTDYMMPKMTGLELCARLAAREDTKDVPVIMMSAGFRGSVESPQVVAFLRKPFLFERLLTTIRAHLKAGPSEA